MTLRSLVARHHQIFNDRDLDALTEVFAEDVELVVDGLTLKGVGAAVGYCAAVFRDFPRLRIAGSRIVAETRDTIVAEHQLLNGDPSGGPLRRQGSTCEIYGARDGRIVSYRSYYAPDGADDEDVVNVPSRGEGSKLAEGRAAFRRVATLVARGVSEDELFAAVSEEVGWLVGADPTSMIRFEPDDTATLVAAWTATGATFPIGTRQRVDAALRALRDDGRVLRFGPQEVPRDGPFAQEARALGVRSVIGIPIVREDRVWGAAFAASTGEEPLPEGAVARIAGFTELVAIALANLEARAELQALVDEQRGLRRLAMLIARGATQMEVLAAVVAETARVLGQVWIALQRFDDDESATVVAAYGDPVPVGQRLPMTRDGVAQRVLSSGRAARVDRYDALPGGAMLTSFGVHAAVGAPIVVDGRLWGLLAVLSRDGPVAPGTEDRLSQFADLAATAIANAESRAALVASRARVVATADETRRRIERDLHDGAQQRLVNTIVSLKLARNMLPGADGPLADLVVESLDHAERANQQLRELVHGILPAALRSGGLRGGVQALVGQIALPVRIEVPAERLPEALETTLYFIVAEALTNVVKHADAAAARVTATVEDGTVRLEVSDDGRGGADVAGGSGLVGLADRVAAGGGTMTLTSPPGAGTTVVVRMPLDGAAAGIRA